VSPDESRIEYHPSYELLLRLLWSRLKSHPLPKELDPTVGSSSNHTSMNYRTSGNGFSPPIHLLIFRKCLSTHDYLNLSSRNKNM
jgi:hypothetical protein